MRFNAESDVSYLQDLPPGVTMAVYNGNDLWDVTSFCL
jgi:hypothetical protein